jgi:hypothetical protein
LSFYGTVADNPHIQYVVYCDTDTNGNGTFAQSMPDGDYIAVLQAANTGTTISGATENMGLQNIGTFSVSGDDITVDLLAVPTLATLSGTASFAGGTLPKGPFTITASDNSLPNLGYINTKYSSYPGYNLYYPRNTTFTQNAFEGEYNMTLGAGSEYNLSYSMLVHNSASSSVGTAYYSPASGASVPLAGAGNTYTYDFDTMPELPSLVTISGRVRDAAANGVDYSVVIARSTSIIGPSGSVIPGLSYYATATADSSGNYTLSLLPGRNYQLYYSTHYMLIIQ